MDSTPTSDGRDPAEVVAEQRAHLARHDEVYMRLSALDEAIEHARTCAARWGDETPCGYAHAQLACWLCELREHRKQAENAYAMRETLKRVEDELAMMNPRGWGDTLAYVRAALAGKPRNCDLYKDCNAAWKAYNAIADRERLPGFDYWLFEEAKQEGAAK